MRNMLFAFCLCGIFTTSHLFANDVPFVWLESETPTSHQGVKELNCWGHDYFSGQWLNLSVDADKLDEQIDGDAVLLKYEFESKAGTFELWNRVGFEYVRSPFEWRIDDGDWQTASPNDLTVDLMEVGFWCEIAWLKLGNVSLQQGKHRLEIKLAKRQNAEGKPERILYASDCICLSPGKFEPYSKFKPNEDHRTEKDIEAAKHVFSLGKNALAGVWEICRDDEYLPEPVAEPISRLPKTDRWSAIQVPGDKNTLRPDLQFAHRVWYRTRVMVPDDAGSALIEFPQNNLNTTVYVNGKLCGFNKNPFAKFHIDISKAIKPGMNEICVGIRDAWYGHSENPNDPMKLRRKFNLPKSYLGQGFQDLAYPIWNHSQSGILVTPTIRFAPGKVYADDVFVKPSVAKKRLDVEVTLKNVSDKDQTVSLTPKVFPVHPVLKQQSRLGDDTFEEIVADTDFHGYTWRETDKIPWPDIYPESKPWIQPMRGDEYVGKPAKEFESKRFVVKANSELVVQLSEPWDDAKLWTPEKPHLYCLDLGPTTDICCGEGVTFGFREWSIDGKNFLLNGKPFHGWADTFDQPTKEQWLDFYRESNQTVMRFWGTTWKGMAPNEALKFFDENGVVVRRSGIFDGEAIGYNVIENDPDLRAINKAEDPAREEIKMDLFRNWRDQMVAQVKGERNHPSVMLWSTENEILYINCINLYGGLMDQFEDEILKTAQAVKEIDPTRSSMVDGGGATKRGNPDNSSGDGLEVHGDHYVVDDFTKYPDRAYDMFPEGGGRGRWFWDGNRPRFIGEDFYVNGIHPAEFAVFGGEEAFGGRTAAKPGVGILYRMLTEGYRWNEYGAWHFWVDQNRASDQYKSNAPIAVFCREYDWTFESGSRVQRTLKIFNDTQKHERIRLTLDWNVKSNSLPPNLTEGFTQKRQKEFDVPAGQSVEVAFEIPVTDIASYKAETKRDEGHWTLMLETQNAADEWREVFRDQKSVSVIDLRGRMTFFAMGAYPPQQVNPLSSISSGSYGRFSLFVYDPHASVTGWLNKHGITHKTLDSLENIPQGEYGRTILLIGKDAIGSAECDSPVLQAFASQGNRVIVLEQKHPLRYGALPCELEIAQNEGRTAFIENESHPVFRDLKQKDFFTWPDGHVVYRDAYRKPSRGARSLLQCDLRLENSAMVEIPVRDGLMILSQTLIGEKLENSVVAKQLLVNLIQYASDYQLQYVPTIVCTAGLDQNFLNELDAAHLKYEPFPDFDSALKRVKATVGLYLVEPGEPHVLRDNWDKAIFVLAASDENLKRLNENREGLQRFYNAGGTILLHDLTPDALTDFNRLVGVEHMIRPFTRERVAFPMRRNSLMQGLSLADIAMSSGERMFGWANDEYVASDTYGYVVDLEDVAPFARYENDFVRMMSNGMVSADGWPYIVNVPAPDDPPLDFSLQFPVEQELAEVTWTGNTFYYPVTRFELFFDGRENETVSFEVEPNAEPQTFAVEPSIRGRNLTLRLADWTKLPEKNQVTGLDNIELIAKRSEEYHAKVRPMLNIGAMVQYQLGAAKLNDCGGVVLCNLRFWENESVPANAVKKRTIFATVLRNLGAEFSEEQTVIAGTPMQYTPVDIAEKCNSFRDARGWFGDANFTFEFMPRGLQKFGGVPFEIYDFPTSPVPNCIIVKENDVPGISVNQKADALFFLHTAKLDHRRNHDELRENKRFEMLKYVIRYADDEVVEVPVDAEIDVDSYRQQEVRPIPGAMLAWMRKYDNTEEHAVAYIKQWNNPRPNVVVKTIDVVRGNAPRGQTAVLAITRAQLTDSR